MLERVERIQAVGFVALQIIGDGIERVDALVVMVSEPSYLARDPACSPTVYDEQVSSSMPSSTMRKGRFINMRM